MEASAGESVAALDHVLADAAAGGRAVTGLAATLEAVACGTVCRLFLDRGFRAPGAVCAHCGVLQSARRPACVVCGQAPARVELAEAMADHVLEAGGTVDVIDGHAGLLRHGGVAACIRAEAPGGRTR